MRLLMDSSMIVLIEVGEEDKEEVEMINKMNFMMIVKEQVEEGVKMMTKTMIKEEVGAVVEAEVKIDDLFLK